MPQLRKPEKVVMAPLQLFPAVVLPMLAGAAVVDIRQAARRLALAVLVAVEQAAVHLLRQGRREPPIQAEVAAAALAAAAMALLAAPASSSCLTRCQSAPRSSSNPRPRGKHRPAQRRWITLSLRVVEVVVEQITILLAPVAQVAAAQEDSAQVRR